METIKVTSRELADKMGVDYSLAAAFVRLLLLKGIATQTGFRPSPTGRGRGSDVYCIPTSFTFTL